MAGQPDAATSCRCSTVTRPGTMPNRAAVRANDAPSSVNHRTRRGRVLAPSRRASRPGAENGCRARSPKTSSLSCIARSQPHATTPCQSPAARSAAKRRPAPARSAAPSRPPPRRLAHLAGVAERRQVLAFLVLRRLRPTVQQEQHIRPTAAPPAGPHGQTVPSPVEGSEVATASHRPGDGDGRVEPDVDVPRGEPVGVDPQPPDREALGLA
jgi:hypothetical protein